MPESRLKHVLALTLSLALGACAVSPASESPAAEWQRYEAAIADAAVARPIDAQALRALPDTPSVQVVSWVIGSRLPCKTALPCDLSVGPVRMWVTLAGELQQACQRWGLSGDALRVRLEQLLGLPPQTPERWRKTHVVTMEVPRSSIERPCLGQEQRGGQTYCTLRARPDTPPALSLFVLEQMSDVFVAGEPERPGYPFTRLGYTYDWHPEARARGHYGASEFVVQVGTRARVLEQTDTSSYCRSPR